jgi:hypothetical protein
MGPIPSAGWHLPVALVSAVAPLVTPLPRQISVARIAQVNVGRRKPASGLSPPLAILATLRRQRAWDEVIHSTIYLAQKRFIKRIATRG